MLTTLLNQPVQSLGLAGNPNMEEGCVTTAYDAGINYFFFYNQSYPVLINELKPLLYDNRESIVVATGSESRNLKTLRAYLDQIRRQLEVDTVDVFYAEYVAPGDDMETLLGTGGMFDEFHRWKAEGIIRYVGATTHNRPMAVELVESGRIDVLMHRYNMAHRGAEEQVLPAALNAGVPVVAFTCTRWGSLLTGHQDWEGPVPTAANCYQYVLTPSRCPYRLNCTNDTGTIEGEPNCLKGHGISSHKNSRSGRRMVNWYMAMELMLLKRSGRSFHGKE